MKKLPQKWLQSCFSTVRSRARKGILPALASVVLVGGLAVPANAQINYSQDFTGCSNNPCGGWQVSGGWANLISDTPDGDGFIPCSGGTAGTNVYSGNPTGVIASTSSLGTSSGLPATLGFTYKLTDYSSADPTAAGEFTITAQWATSASGPWAPITTFPNASSATCIPVSANFTPTAGQPIFVRILSQYVSGDAYTMVDNITLTQSAGANCTGTPAPGNTLASSSSVCGGESFTLSLQNSTAGDGVTYQWQSSPDGTTWTNVGSGFATYSTSQTAATYYQAIVTCTSSGQSAPSNPVQVTMNSFLSCYCSSGAQYSADTDIGNVTFGSLNNGSATPVLNNSGATGTYSDFTSLPAASFAQGETYAISISQITSGGTFYGSHFNVFIDYNQDGTFDPVTERVFDGAAVSSTNSTVTGAISIPATAMLGTTRMRVVQEEGGDNTTSPCGSYGYGETEDYLITITSPPACVSPSGASIANITSTSADLTWNCTSCTGTYIVEYGPSATFTTPGTGATAGAGGTIASVNATSPLTLSGLANNTEYRVFVRQNCGANGYSNNYPVSLFTTLCGTVTTFPYTEGFETSSVSCWSVIDNNADGDSWSLSSTYPRTGSWSARMYSDGNSTNDDYLISPQIALPANHQLRFWARAQSTNEPDEISVRISTTGKNVADFTAIALPSTPVSTTTYVEHVVNLSAFTGNVYIAFVRNGAPADGWNLYLDDITVQEIPACPAPTAFSASNITSGSVQLNFTSSASSFIVEYGPAATFTTPGTGATAGTGGTVITTVTGSPYTVSGLASTTEYRFFVRANCAANGFSANAGPVTATTAPSCPSGLGAGLNTIASLPYSATGLTTCGNGNNVTAANTSPLTCGNTNYLGGEDATHVFTPAVTGQITITMTTSASWTGLLLYSNCPFSGNGTTCVGASTGSLGNKTLTATVTAGQTYYLVVDTYPSPNCISTYSLSISAPVTCPAPSAVSASNNTLSAVQLNFTNNGGGGTFIVEYGPSATFTTPGTGATAGAGGTVITGIAGSPYTVTGLSNATNYRFFVRQDCGSGDFSTNSAGITSSTLSPPPANDNCAGAISLPVYTAGSCVAVNGTTAGATQSAAGCAGTADDDVWFTFVATQTSQVVTVTGASSFDAVLQVFTACGGTSLDCKDQTGSGSAEVSTLTGLTVGNTYAVRVYHYSSSVSSTPTFTICVTEPALPPANDDCAGAIMLPVNAFGACAPVTGTTAAASQSLAACAGTANDDVWYSFVATHTNHTIIVDGETGFDAVVNLRSGGCNGTTMVCRDNTAGGGIETINATGLTIGDTYFVRVHHYSSSLATNPTFTICVTAPNCANATTPVSNNGPVNYGNTISLTASGAMSYTWSGPNGFSSTDQNPQISNATPANAGVYSVTGINNAGCAYLATTTVSVGNVLYLTINQNQPASGTNFASMASAAAYLNTTGVTTETVIDVVAGSGDYAEQLLLNEIPGASATNTVTINGNGNTITHCSTTPANRDIIRLNGTDHVTVNGFVLNATCSQGWGVHVMGDVENVTISNNTIHLSPQYSGYVGNMNGIIVGNSFTDPAMMAGTVTGLTIAGNTINSGYHGIRINGNTTNVASNVNITGNILNAPKVFGVFMSYGDNVSVDQNQVLMFNAPAGTVLSSMGIYLVHLENLASVQRNKVTNAGHMGVWLNYVNRNTTARGMVANNMIGGGFRNSTTFGVQLNSASNLDLYYNSINVDFGTTGVGLYVSNLLSRELTLVNNSIAYTGTSAAGRAMQAGDAFENFTAIDYNNYYSTGTNVVYFNRGWRSNLAALQASVNNGFVHDMNSIEADPQYMSATDLHISATSPLREEAMPMASVTVDYDGNTRSTTAPAIGADEFIAPVRLAAATELDVQVYPNPFRDELKVDVTGMEGAVELTLVDMMGRQVYSRTYDASAGVLTLQPQVQLAQGVYLLQVGNNGSVTQIRVVKQ